MRLSILIHLNAAFDLSENWEIWKAWLLKLFWNEERKHRHFFKLLFCARPDSSSTKSKSKRVNHRRVWNRVLHREFLFVPWSCQVQKIRTLATRRRRMAMNHFISPFFCSKPSRRLLLTIRPDRNRVQFKFAGGGGGGYSLTLIGHLVLLSSMRFKSFKAESK
jgi:hypothetical protein